MIGATIKISIHVVLGKIPLAASFFLCFTYNPRSFSYIYKFWATEIRNSILRPHLQLVLKYNEYLDKLFG